MSSDGRLVGWQRKKEIDVKPKDWRPKKNWHRKVYGDGRDSSGGD